MKGTTTRGAALISALILTLILTLMIGGMAYEVGTSTALEYARDHQDSAMDLAEAGISYELNYISSQERNNGTLTFHTKTYQSGQPYPGQPGTVTGTPGEYWVYTVQNAGNSFTVYCTAEVGGEIATVNHQPVLINGAAKTLQVNGSTQSLLGIYAAFASRAPNASNHSADVVLANGSVVKLQTNSNVAGLTATFGTNGSVAIGTGASIAASSGYTANFLNADANSSYNSNAQFKSGTTIKDGNIESPFPTVPSIIRYTFPATAGLADQAAWSWLSNNNANAGIDTYKSGLPMGTSLNPSSVTSAGFTTSSNTLTNSSTGGGLGNWQNAGDVPGTTVQALIFPPGDYYFTSVNLVWNANTEIIIDNAGLTNGGAPGPVRFWFNSTGNDSVALPFTLTNTADPSTFRLYYGKDGYSLTITKPSGPPAGNWTLPGAIYAISGGTLGTTVQLAGGADAGDQVVLDGSIIADHIGFSGYCTLIFDPTDSNSADYQAGAGFVGGYVQDTPG